MLAASMRFTAVAPISDPLFPLFYLFSTPESGRMLRLFTAVAPSPHGSEERGLGALEQRDSRHLGNNNETFSTKKKFFWLALWLP